MAPIDDESDRPTSRSATDVPASANAVAPDATRGDNGAPLDDADGFDLVATDPSVTFESLFRSIRQLRDEGRAIDEARLIERFPAFRSQLERVFRTFRERRAWESKRREPLASPATPSRPAEIAPGIPCRLDQYELLEEIGRGGMGVVFAALDVGLDRTVAVKILPQVSGYDTTRRLRFENEARAAAKLHHPHIVPIYGSGQDQGIHYFVMQRIEGRNLAELIDDVRSSPDPQRLLVAAETRPISATQRAGVGDMPTAVIPSSHRPSSHRPSSRIERSSDGEDDTTRSAASSHIGAAFCRRVAEIGVQVARALDHAHRCGVVHRDIKPSNLILDTEGKVWITDFGLALTAESESLTGEGDIIGTLRYMSVEQVIGHSPIVDHRTDIYSLGVTLYELLVQQHAIRGRRHHEIRHAIGSKNPIPLRKINRRIPEELARIVAKAMSRDAEDRYRTAGDFAADLQAYLDHRPVQARPIPLPKRLLRRAQTHWIGATAVLASLAIGFVGALVATGWAFGEARGAYADADRERTGREADREEFRERIDQAEDERLRAEARRLAATDPPRALVAAAELHRRTPDADSGSLLVDAWLRNDVRWSASLDRNERPTGLWVGAIDDRSAELIIAVTASDGQASLLGLRFDEQGVRERFRRDLRRSESEDRNVAPVAAVAPDRTHLLAGTSVAAGAERVTAPTARLMTLESGASTELPGAYVLAGGERCFDPTGRSVLTGGPDGETLLWNVSRGARIASFPGGTRPVRAAEFSGDGRRLAVVDTADQVRVLAVTGETLTAIDLAGPAAGGASRVRRVSLSHDGSRLLVATLDDGLMVYRVAAEGTSGPQTLRLPAAVAWEGTFLGDGERIAVWYSGRKDLLLVSADDGAVVDRIATPSFERVTANRTGSRLLIEPSAERLGGAPPAPLFVETDRIEAATRSLKVAERWLARAWSSDGRYLASIDAAGRIEIRVPGDRESRLVRVPDHHETPGGTITTIAGGDVAISVPAIQAVVEIDSTGRVRSSMAGHGPFGDAAGDVYDDPLAPRLVLRRTRFRDAPFRATEADLATDESDEGARRDAIPFGAAQLIDPTTGNVLRTHRGSAEYNRCLWSADRKIYVLQDLQGGVVAHRTSDGTLLWRSPPSLAVRLEWSPLGSGMIAVEPNGNASLVRFVDGAVTAQPIRANEVDRSLPVRITGAAWHPGGRELLLVDRERTIRRLAIDPVANGPLTAEPIARSAERIELLMFSAAGGRVVARLKNGSIVAWPFEGMDLPPSDSAPSASESTDIASNFDELPLLTPTESMAAGGGARMLAIPGSDDLVVVDFDHGPRLWPVGGTPRELLGGKCAAATVSRDGAELAAVMIDETNGPSPFRAGPYGWIMQRRQTQRIVRVSLRDREEAGANVNRTIVWRGGLVTSIEPAGDGGWVLGTEAYGIERIAAGESSDQTLRLGDHAAPVTSCARVPREGSEVWALGSLDQTVRLWEVTRTPRGPKAEPIGEPLEHESSVRHVASSPDGRSLAVALHDGSIVLWDLAVVPPTSETVAGDRPIRQLTVTSDGIEVVKDGGEWIRRDVRQDRSVTVPLEAESLVAFATSPAGDRLAWIPSGEPVPRLMIADLEGNRRTTVLDGVAEVRQIGWLDPTTVAILTGDGRLLASGADGAVEERARLDGAVAFGAAADGDRVALVGRDALLLVGPQRAETRIDGLEIGPVTPGGESPESRLRWNEATASWWIVTSTGGLLELPGDPLEAARQAASRLR
ncbi:MAG TPA: serine/threonine-protein kinase [Pirellulaceae bacterium]|nr:serine/threonine-protein kinase [Pirellulaceae bacterium]